MGCHGAIEALHLHAKGSARMPVTWCESLDLEAIAARVGTPFYLYDAATLRGRVEEVRALTAAPGLQARFAMKACSARRVLEVMREGAIWIDAVSGNEVLRARQAGYPMGAEPPAVLLTADVFRDNALDVVRQHGILPNVGSPGMLRALRDGGYRGPVGFRLNPGFGHGHVQACDTGGPSSKHGLWHEDDEPVRREARSLGFPVALLHAHIGTGPQVEEFNENMIRLGGFFSARIADYPEATGIALGGGIPYPYRPDAPRIDLRQLGATLLRVQAEVSRAAGRDIRVEIEPGRYFVAPVAVLVARVTDVKQTRANAKGSGHLFTMVDAGFCDLVRPAMYGSYHHITVHGRGGPLVPTAVAGPLCESGDVFTRDADELIDPRLLPQARPGDLLVLHDAGAYGAAMSSNYNSIGRVPQVWIEDGTSYLMSRRETLDDIVRTECFEAL
jgi:diaminopimelate decarboxylase